MTQRVFSIDVQIQFACRQIRIHSFAKTKRFYGKLASH